MYHLIVIVSRYRCIYKCICLVYNRVCVTLILVSQKGVEDRRVVDFFPFSMQKIYRLNSSLLIMKDIKSFRFASSSEPPQVPRKIKQEYLDLAKNWLDLKSTQLLNPLLLIIDNIH